MRPQIHLQHQRANTEPPGLVRLHGDIICGSGCVLVYSWPPGEGTRARRGIGKRAGSSIDVVKLELAVMLRRFLTGRRVTDVLGPYNRGCTGIRDMAAFGIDVRILYDC